MKNINKYFIGMLVPVLFSCDQGFDEMNINPIALTNVEPIYQLNTAMVSSAPTYGNLSYETTIVKQMITPFSGVGSAANYNQDNRSVAAGNWQNGYRTVIKNIEDVIHKTKDDPNTGNAYQIARIWRAYAFMTLTDTYGDVPYFEAGKVFLEGLTSPVYDRQEDIYDDILNELEAASNALDVGRGGIENEILYSGDVEKWKRFGNSLLLRAAMRLSKVDPAKASSYVTRAVAGGLMQSNQDNAVIRHNSNFTNPVGSQLNGGQSAFFYLAEDFVSYLKETNDPRLASIAVRYVGAASGTDQIEGNASRNPEIQIGMPLGFDNTTISAVLPENNLVSLWDFSQLDRTRMANLQAPSFLVTYAQTQLLLAEAALRNWIQGDPAGYYANGIEAHMSQLAAYGAAVAVSTDNINAYVQANPFQEDNGMELINTQYWIASFLIGPEAWANFRRSGFPLLSPNPFPGNDLQSEDFIRRLTYTNAEINVNQSNVHQAISRQGPDTMDTRVWWDVP